MSILNSSRTTPRTSASQGRIITQNSTLSARLRENSDVVSSPTPRSVSVQSRALDVVSPHASVSNASTNPTTQSKPDVEYVVVSKSRLSLNSSLNSHTARENVPDTDRRTDESVVSNTPVVDNVVNVSTAHVYPDTAQSTVDRPKTPDTARSNQYSYRSIKSNTPGPISRSRQGSFTVKHSADQPAAADDDKQVLSDNNNSVDKELVIGDTNNTSETGDSNTYLNSRLKSQGNVENQSGIVKQNSSLRAREKTRDLHEKSFANEQRLTAPQHTRLSLNSDCDRVSRDRVPFQLEDQDKTVPPLDLNVITRDSTPDDISQASDSPTITQRSELLIEDQDLHASDRNTALTQFSNRGNQITGRQTYEVENPVLSNSLPHVKSSADNFRPEGGSGDQATYRAAEQGPQPVDTNRSENADLNVPVNFDTQTHSGEQPEHKQHSPSPPVQTPSTEKKAPTPSLRSSSHVYAVANPDIQRAQSTQREQNSHRAPSTQRDQNTQPDSDTHHTYRQVSRADSVTKRSEPAEVRFSEEAQRPPTHNRADSRVKERVPTPFARSPEGEPLPPTPPEPSQRRGSSKASFRGRPIQHPTSDTPKSETRRLNSEDSQSIKRVYVESPSFTKEEEDVYRFVSSRLDDIEDNQDTVRDMDNTRRGNAANENRSNNYGDSRNTRNGSDYDRRPQDKNRYEERASDRYDERNRDSRNDRYADDRLKDRTNRYDDRERMNGRNDDRNRDKPNDRYEDRGRDRVNDRYEDRNRDTHNDRYEDRNRDRHNDRYEDRNNDRYEDRNRESRNDRYADRNREEKSDRNRERDSYDNRNRGRNDDRVDDRKRSQDYDQRYKKGPERYDRRQSDKDPERYDRKQSDKGPERYDDRRPMAKLPAQERYEDRTREMNGYGDKDRQMGRSDERGVDDRRVDDRVPRYDDSSKYKSGDDRYDRYEKLRGERDEYEQEPRRESEPEVRGYRKQNTELDEQELRREAEYQQNLQKRIETNIKSKDDRDRYARLDSYDKENDFPRDSLDYTDERDGDGRGFVRDSLEYNYNQQQDWDNPPQNPYQDDEGQYIQQGFVKQDSKPDFYDPEDVARMEIVNPRPIKCDYVEKNKYDYGLQETKSYRAIVHKKKEEETKLDSVFITPKVPSKAKKKASQKSQSAQPQHMGYKPEPQYPMGFKPSSAEEVWKQKSQMLSVKKDSAQGSKPPKGNSGKKAARWNSNPQVKEARVFEAPPPVQSGQPYRQSNAYVPEKQSRENVSYGQQHGYGTPTRQLQPLDNKPVAPPHTEMMPTAVNPTSPFRRHLELKPITQEITTEDGQRISVDINLRLVSPPPGLGGPGSPHQQQLALVPVQETQAPGDQRGVGVPYQMPDMYGNYDNGYGYADMYKRDSDRTQTPKRLDSKESAATEKKKVKFGDQGQYNDGYQEAVPMDTRYDEARLTAEEQALADQTNYRNEAESNEEMQSLEEGYSSLYQKMRTKDPSEHPWYKVYSLGDYRKMKKEVQLSSGTLGPDLDTETYKDKLEKRHKQFEYARMVMERNRMELGSKKPPKFPKQPERPGEEGVKRKTALEYARNVPKPLVKARPSQYNSYEVSSQLPPGAPTKGRTQPPSSKSTTPPAQTMDVIDIRTLEQRHIQERKNTDKMRQNMDSVLSTKAH